MRANLMRKSQSSRCRTFRTTANVQVNQEELLVAVVATTSYKD